MSKWSEKNKRQPFKSGFVIKISKKWLIIRAGYRNKKGFFFSLRWTFLYAVGTTSREQVTDDAGKKRYSEGI